MSKGKIVIGTSGWNYRHWKGTFYPEDLPVKNWLKYYYEHFKSVELNTSFYHLPKRLTFENWRDAVPSEFIFTVKASRYITHITRLNDPEEPLKKFFDNAYGLENKLGPVLFQLPPGWKYNSDRFKEFVTFLPKNTKPVFEFRNNTWWNDEVYALLDKYNCSFCIFELAGQKTPELVTGNRAYVRLHGPTGYKYQGSYDDDTLLQWSKKFTQWEKEGKEVYCYFDNDDSGYAAFNALTIQNMVNGKG